MTGPSGNRLSICPLRFRITSPKISIDSWGGDPDSLEANRSAYYPRDQSLFVYYFWPSVEARVDHINCVS